MTCFTYYHLEETVKDPWNICMIHHNGEASADYQCSEERPPDGG